MEKYGVEEKGIEEDNEKKAQEKNHCPFCGTLITNPETTGGIKICPKCGTRPFEVE